MPNTVGQIVVKLKAEIAEFISDMGKANQEATRTAASINREIKANTREAKESLELLGESFGVHLPRSIRKTLAELDGFRDLAAAAFEVSFITAFAGVLIEKVVPAIEKGAQALAGWGEAEQEAYKEAVKVNSEIAETVKKTKELAFENSLIGKSAEEQAKLRAEHAAEEKKTAQDRLNDAIANLQRIRKAEADAAAAAMPQSSPYAADLSASTYTDVLAANATQSKEIADANAAIAKAQAEVGLESTKAAGKVKEYSEALKQAGEEAAQKAKQHQQEVAAALQSISGIGVRIARDSGDVIGEINARNDAEFAKVRALGQKYPEVWAVSLDAELQIRLAKRKEIADAEVKLLMDANRAVADTVKAGEAGIIAALNLGGSKSVVTFSHNPFQDQIDALNGPGAQAAIDRGKIMDDMWTQLRTHSEQYAFEVQKVDAAYAGSKISTEYVHALEVIKQHYDENTIALNQFANQAGQSMQSLIAGTETWQNALKGVLGELILLIPKLLFAKEIQSMMAPGAGGGTNFIGGLLGGLLGVGHADGGAVSAGTIYPVGEKGPELFMPGTSGTIIPNHNLGGGASVIVNNDFRGVDAATIPYVEQRVAQGVRVAVQQALAKGADQQRRR